MIPLVIKEPHMRIERLRGNPMIRPHMDARMGTHINGPSLLRVPHWMADPLGTYYLCFAAHQGHSIRLAYADQLEGPWRLYAPGTLRLEPSHFLTTPPAGPPELQPRLAAMAKQRAGMVGVESPIENATAVPLASPDVQVIEERHEIRLYVHGLARLSAHRGVASCISLGREL
jgi:hypothetical protein